MKLPILDAHINLDTFPTSRRSHTLFTRSLQEIAQYIKVNDITDAVILYPRDKYELMEKLAKLCKDVNLYGLQVLGGITAEDATDVTKVELDVLKGYKYCYGIKLASHRGWWKREDISAGLNYDTYSSLIKSWLDQLPENSLVSMHTQGEPCYSLANTSLAVANYANKYPKLKFIINHMGDFGQRGFSAKPKKYRYVDDKMKEHFYPPFRYAHHRAIVNSAIEFSSWCHNILLETSIFTQDKASLLKGSKATWGIGSDYPFLPDEDGLQKQYELFIKVLGEEVVRLATLKALSFLKKTYLELIEDTTKLQGLE